MPFAHDHFRFLGILLNLAADDEKLRFYVFMAQRLQNIFKRSCRRGPVIERQHDSFASTEPITNRVVITRFVMIPFVIPKIEINRFVIIPFFIVSHTSSMQKKSTINAAQESRTPNATQASMTKVLPFVVGHHGQLSLLLRHVPAQCHSCAATF
jgi:hypothetical protein